MADYIHRGTSKTSLEAAIESLPDRLKSVDTDFGPTSFLEFGDGRPLIIIHDGAPGADSVSCWYQCMDALAAKFRIIAVDMLGFGANANGPEPELEFSHEARVSHLLEFLKARRLEKVDILGFSLGGAVALDVAIQQPDAVGGLIVAAPAGLSREIPPEVGPLMGYRGEAEQMHALFSALGGPSFAAENALVDYRTRLSNQPENASAWQRAMQDIGNRGGLYLDESALASIRSPSLLVYGEHDPILTATTARQFRDTVQDSTIHEAPDCGHWIPYEAPEFLTRLCRRHF